MSVGISQNEAQHVIAAINQDSSSFGISIACVNSPNNVTLAGETRLIDRLQTQFDEQKVFSRKLRVPVAYHSRQMDSISERYTTMIGSLSTAKGLEETIPMISSVTGERALPEQLIDPKYWASNMVSPVQFQQAVSVMCEHWGANIVKKIDRSHLFTPVVNHLVEVGPHAALQGPIRGILQSHPRNISVGYNAILRRGQSALETMLSTLGELYCMGYSVNLRAVNAPSLELRSSVSPSLLVDIPSYPFDRTQRYWQESRISRNYRLRSHCPSKLLGVRSNDWNASEAQWRHFIRTSDVPWTEQHVINGTVLYPGAGMLVMAIEAAKQLTGDADTIQGFTLRSVSIDAPMKLLPNNGSLEIKTSLHKLQSNADGKAFKFAIRTWSKDDWILNCHGFIFVESLHTRDSPWAQQKDAEQRLRILSHLEGVFAHCKRPVESPKMYGYLKLNGYDYGPDFQAAERQQCNDRLKQATAQIKLFDADEASVIHPVSLDAILHLSFTARTAGGSMPMTTSVPARIGCIWVANRGLSWSEKTSVTACTTIQKTTKRGFTCAGGVLSNDETKQLCLWYDDLELVHITSQAKIFAKLPNPRQFSMAIEQKPAVHKLSNSELFAFLRSSCPIRQDLSSFYGDVRRLVGISLERLAKSVNISDVPSHDPWRRNYWKWALYHLERNRDLGHQEELESTVPNADIVFESLCKKIASTSRLGRLYAVTASNLIPMFCGEANPVEILKKPGLFKDGYAEWTEYDCAKQIAMYMDLLAHQKPGMNILEVGGGTAAATRNFIRALRSGADESVRSLRCKRYDFTDVSAAFLESSSEEFSVYKSQMTYGVLNIERSFAEQGFSETFYDVVIADNVLHVTPDLHQTLRNIRRALKPGGKLIMQEFIRPTGWTTGFIFGLFPEWWLRANDGRTLSPSLAPSEWDALLKDNGFSGIDMIFRDSHDDGAQQIAWLVATATEDATVPSPTAVRQLKAKDQAVIIVDNAVGQQISLAESMISSLIEITGSHSSIIDITTASQDPRVEDGSLVILLVDYGTSFIGSLNKKTWECISSLIQRVRRLLWVSAGGGREPSPNHGMIDGLARTLRFENYQLHLVTVALNPQQREKSSLHLTTVVREMLSKDAHEIYEQDYTEIDGLLYIRRLTEADHIKTGIDESVTPYQVSSTPLDSKIRLRISPTSTIDSDSTPHFVQIPESSLPSTLENTVEILVKAVSVQSRGNSVLPNQEEYPVYGTHWAGIVVRAGPEADFIPGDRVFAAQIGPLSSHIEVPSRSLVNIAADLSFTDVCSVIPPVAMAYHALVKVSNARPGNAILIQDGYNAVGQAAMQILRSQGILDIWATATDGGYAKHNSLRLPEDRILPENWFTTHSMASYQWKQRFDIALTQETNIASSMLDHVKCNGHVVALDATAASTTTSRPEQALPVNFHFSRVSIGTEPLEALLYATDVASTMLQDLKIEAKVLPASDVPSIVSRVQISTQHTSTVVEFNEGHNIDVSFYDLQIDFRITKFEIGATLWSYSAKHRR